jgi:hypothetical protein
MRVFDPDDDKGRAGQIRRRRATRWDKFKRLMMGDW